MNTVAENNQPPVRLGNLPRNVWAVSLTSFFMDISSEMVLNLLPLYLSNVLGVKTNIIGLIEGVAEATSSLLKLFSGWISDRLQARKWPAVIGYALSAATRPFFYVASTWGAVATVRWIDRVGKGIRTAPRDALVADSVPERGRGLAFGFQRAADTAGAMFGLLIALGIVWWTQSGLLELRASVFQIIVLASLLPAALAVLSLVIGARDVPVHGRRAAPRFAFNSLGRPFMAFLLIVGLFELGNSSDAFLVLRAQERGVSVSGVLAMLVVFNLIYTLVSTPAGSLSDRIGRRKVIVSGWLAFAAVYLGFGLARNAWQIWGLYAAYGLYYGLAYGTSKALVADLIPDAHRGAAYGTYNALLGILDLPASLIAGLLWQGAGSWAGWGPAAPFLFGAGMALLAAGLLALWLPRVRPTPQPAGTNG
jgi:MFS family permease